MRFPRSAKILRSQFDVAPFAAVFFCLLLFVLLGTLLPVPGLKISLQPPQADGLPGITGPTLNVAVDSQGRLYFKNQIVSEAELKIALTAAAQSADRKPALVIHADKSATYDQLVRLTLLARDAGITNNLLATLPRLSDTPTKP
jgi:biopolymer transport protein ExbD